MAPIKRELGFTPPPREGFGSFKCEAEPSMASSFAKSATTSLIPEAHWRECDNEERMKRVVIKELAARNAYSSLQQMLKTLANHLPLNPSCQPRIEKIREIIGRKKEFQVLIGFLGVTGAGKTTLLNALIGCANLLPSSAWRASTAVPVEVSYNRNSDPGSAFRAEVVYITKEEWGQELDSIFEDMKAAGFGHQGDDGDDDSERKDRMKKAFDKIKYVYPTIRSLEKLAYTSSVELLDHPEVRDIFGTTTKIATATKAQLSEAIKKYIDSGDHKEKTSSHWPLVKLVRVYIRSGLLEPGIILVDLPGNVDTNAARSAIAEKYHNDLTVACIVGDVTRGISEKNAHELLEKFTKRNLQLDGMYNAESLCFVLSKVDQGFEFNQYMKQYPELGEQLAADNRKQWTLKGDISELERERNTTDRSHTKNFRKSKELAKEIKAVKSRLNDLSRNSAPLPPSRKRNSDYETSFDATPASEEQLSLRSKLAELEKKSSDLKSTTQEQADELLSYGRRIKHLNKALFFARSRIATQCIQHRNDLSKSAVTNDYETTLREMDREPDKQLQVFPVSANIHLWYQNSSHATLRHLSFPNREDTRIPALRDWLLSTTYDTRERLAQAFLDEVDIFLAFVQPWLADRFAEGKMSAKVKEYWQPQIKLKVDELEADLRRLSIKTADAMKQLVETNIYSKVPEAQRLAGSKAQQTAEKWVVGTHWSTYRCVHREKGVWVDSKNKAHKWNEELVHDFSSHIVKAWDATFFRKFPQEKIKYVDDAKALVAAFVSTAIDKDMCPDVADAISVLRDRIIRADKLLRTQTDSAFDDIKKGVKKSHKEAVPAVKEFLGKMYEHCASESGRGHYGRSRTYVHDFMTRRGEAIHRAGTRAIKADLEVLLDSVPVNLATGYNLLLRQIRDEITNFFEKHSSDGSRSSTRKVNSNFKAKLQQDLRTDINNLGKLWNEPHSDRAEVPEDDDTEDEMQLTEGLYIDLDKDSDGDYEDNSDGDAD